MVWHTVWFKLKEDVSAEQKQAMLDGLNALPAQIEHISTLSCGEDFCGRSKGYGIGLVVSFATRADLDSYGPHAAHQAFVENFKPLWDDVMALDFEV